MRRSLLCAATAGCLLLVGCGVSTAELRIGDSLAVGMHHGRSGRTTIGVTVGSRAVSRTCEASLVSVAWDHTSAQLSTC